MDRHEVIFEPSGLRISVDELSTVLDAARDIGIHVSAECGGRGTCGKCNVIMQPSPSPTSIDLEHLSQEQIDDGTRLSCQHRVTSILRVILPYSFEKAKILTEGRAEESYISIDKGLDGKKGIAIDIGTTTIVCYLMDLGNGVQLGQVSSLNPQIAFGEDVMSRITYAMQNEQGAAVLQQRLVEKLNNLSIELCDKTGTDVDDLVKYSLVGNTAMHHFFLGLGVSSLGLAPYQPVKKEAHTAHAASTGLRYFKNAELYFSPIIAGFVGGDTSAFILSERFDLHEGVTMGIDIGTNGEIVLSKNGQIYCCSAAAGSAFEGATISQGMRAQDGAIEHVEIWNPDVPPDLTVIGSLPPKGICGSAIVDVIAELRRVGIVNKEGRMKKSARVVKDDEKMLSYSLVNIGELKADRPIHFTQKDVRQVQLAKAAILAGAKILMEEAGIGTSDLSAILLAGAFGNYIRPSSALAIGLLPAVQLEKVIPVGNAAGEGAKKMLLSTEQRMIAEELASSAQYIELANHQDFESTFIESTVLERIP